MEIRVLKYFLAVAREGSITKAANSLHLTQPTLTRQLQDLEKELGQKLLVRGTLTPEGIIFKKRAEEIVEMVEKTENEFRSLSDTISGDIYIGGGETDSMKYIAKIMKEIQDEYPQVKFHIYSGNAEDVTEKLDKGLIDFAVLVGYAIDISKYHSIKLPNKETWGVLMKNDCVLAQKEYVTAQDLWDKPLIVSRQAIKGKILTDWLEKDISQLNIIAYYNLIYNASLMVEEGLGYALCIDKIINITEDSNICFKPFYPNLEVGMDIVWKKYQVFSRASQKFLEALKQML